MSELFFNNPGLKKGLICQMKPSEYDLFVKTLNFTGLNVMNIKDSKLTSHVSGGLIHTDFTKTLGGNINIAFMLTKESRKMIKKLKGNDDVLIIDANESYYRITNGTFDFGVSKTNLSAQAMIPELSGEYPSVTIEPDNITPIIGKHGQADILIYDDELASVISPSQTRYNLESSALGEFEGREPDLVLRAYSFLMFAGKEVNLTIKQDGNDYWLCTATSFTDDQEVTYYQKLTVVSKQ